jgi:iron complex outermembrane receptor protein
MITFSRASILLASASLLVGAPAAFAQDIQAQDDGSLADLTAPIVVTATKKKDVENVQSVPLAVTALNAGTLEAMKVRDIQSLTYSAPGVSLDQVGTSRGTANFSIRGLGINSSIPSIEPTVGTFVDGVYMGVNNGVVFDTFDLDSVEILRGPQGILFGRNTTGGAVLLNSTNPTKDWTLKLRGGFDGPVDSGRGALNMTMQGVVSGPLSDSVGVKLGAYHNNDGGYFKNLYDNANFGKAETTILRGGLAYKSGALKLSLKGEYFDSNGDGAIAQNHGIYARDSFQLALNNPGFYKSRAYFGVLRGDYDIGSGVITSITGYRKYDASTDNDIDATARTLFNSRTWLAQKQWSEELRYNGRFGALDLTLGGYLFHQQIGYDELRDLPVSSPRTFYGGGRENHHVYGTFVAADYDLTEQLTMNAGIRWSKEDKDGAVTYVRPRPACSVIDQTCPTIGTNLYVPGEKNGFTDSRSWSNWTPKLGLTYKLNPDVLGYAHWTRAYRSGGYNFRITAPTAFEAILAAGGKPAFDAEQVDSYETGLKYQTPDRKGTVNLAAYHTVIGNMQREINQSSATSGVAQSIFNTADARIWGGEVEARYAISKSLVLSANVGYIDAKYTKIRYDISGNGSIGAEDYALWLPRVPKWTWGGTVIHDLNLGDARGNLISRISFQHRTKYAYTDDNLGWVGKSDNLDANLTWKTPLKGLSISVYGKNLLDEVQFGGDTQVPFGGALSTGQRVPLASNPTAGTFSPLAKGRVIGMEIGIEF